MDFGGSMLKRQRYDVLISYIGHDSYISVRVAFNKSYYDLKRLLSVCAENIRSVVNISVYFHNTFTLFRFWEIGDPLPEWIIENGCWNNDVIFMDELANIFSGINVSNQKFSGKNDNDD